MAPWLTLLTRLAAAVPLAVSATTCAAPHVVTHPHAPHASSTPSHHKLFRGADISWPNCPKGTGIKHRHGKNEPMPERNARFVIVGVTNGPGFHPNPCLSGELRWVALHHRWLGGYAMTTYPTTADIAAYGSKGPYDDTTATGRLRNTARAEATFNINTIARHKMDVPMLWVDVEPYPFWPWSSSHRANRAVVRAVIKRYRAAGHTVGIYTYLNGWHEVVGNWRLPHVPAWSTAGQGTRKQAKRMCTRGPSGGPTWVTQWYTLHQDFDLLCRAAPAKSEVLTAPS
ncbi:MAG: hypothetical protein JO214_11500 [Frankiaceae bacterium]|nr:hypothetical protein [Frankiaceae bacterium]